MFDHVDGCLITQARVDVVDEPNDEEDSKADALSLKGDAGPDMSGMVIS
jgi:hypothetical protein